MLCNVLQKFWQVKDWLQIQNCCIITKSKRYNNRVSKSEKIHKPWQMSWVTSFWYCRHMNLSVVHIKQHRVILVVPSNESTAHTGIEKRPWSIRLKHRKRNIRRSSKVEVPQQEANSKQTSYLVASLMNIWAEPGVWCEQWVRTLWWRFYSDVNWMPIVY